MSANAKGRRFLSGVKGMDQLDAIFGQASDASSCRAIPFLRSSVVRRREWVAARPTEKRLEMRHLCESSGHMALVTERRHRWS